MKCPSFVVTDLGVDSLKHRAEDVGLAKTCSIGPQMLELFHRHQSYKFQRNETNVHRRKEKSRLASVVLSSSFFFRGSGGGE